MLNLRPVGYSSTLSASRNCSCSCRFWRYISIMLLYLFLLINAIINNMYVCSWFWGPVITLQDCLAAFFSADDLKGDNMYSCEKCKKSVFIKSCSFAVAIFLLFVLTGRHKTRYLEGYRLRGGVALNLVLWGLKLSVNRGHHRNLT